MVSPNYVCYQPWRKLTIRFRHCFVNNYGLMVTQRSSMSCERQYQLLGDGFDWARAANLQIPSRSDILPGFRWNIFTVIDAPLVTWRQCQITNRVENYGRYIIENNCIFDWVFIKTATRRCLGLIDAKILRCSIDTVHTKMSRGYLGTWRYSPEKWSTIGSDTDFSVWVRWDVSECIGQGAQTHFSVSPAQHI